MLSLIHIYKLEPDVKIVDAEKKKVNKSIVMLEGLGCANCAAKMEKEISGLEGVEFAAVDFVSKKLTLEISPKVNRSELNEKIEGIVKKIEPDVKVIFEENNSKTKINENNEEEEEGVNKKEIIRLVVGGAIFAVGIIFNFQNWLELTLFIISYIIAVSYTHLDVYKRQIFSYMQECDLIIIDDVFYVEPTRAELQVFYRAVTFLNETRSIIFITNRELSAWIDAAEDKHLCQTLLDRMTVNCQIVRLTDK